MMPIAHSRSSRHACVKVDNQSSMALADEPCLPEYILEKIFLGIPTKLLVQLKCVSKQWNRLISDPYFMKSRSRRMIFLPGLPFHAIDSTLMIKLCSPFDQESYKEMTIVGSFNGIVLLVLNFFSHYDHMILYNPFSGKFKTVPDNPPPSGTYVYGFGYGTTADDLKIVRLRKRSSSVYGASKPFEVFSLKTWSWSRPSELIRDYFFWSDSGTFANGFLYWITGTKLLALDMKNMVFSEINFPNKWMNNLGTYNGRLCMICKSNNVDEYELWVMNKLGSGTSWSKVCSFKPVFGSFCILDEGKLLILKSSKQLIMCDMFKDSYQEVNALMSFGQVGRLQAVEYVESLVSPSGICSISI